MFTKSQSEAFRIALRVSLVYAIFGGLWILLSDRLLETFVKDISQLSTIQTYKGWLFVALSALLIHSLLWRELHLRGIAERQVHQLRRLYATLSQVNQMIVRVQDRDQLFVGICEVAVKFGELHMSWIGLIDTPSGEVRPVAASGNDMQEFTLQPTNILEEEFLAALTTQAIQTFKVVTSENILTDMRIAKYTSHLQPYPYRAAAIIPFSLKDKPIGVLVLLSKEHGIFKDADEIDLLNEMGLDISFALDNIENEKERKLMEQALRISEERFRLLFENNHSIMLLIDPVSGFIRDANAAAARFYGYSLPELRSMKIDQINKQTPEEVYEERMRVLRQEKNYFNFQHRLQNGEIRSVEVYSTPIELEGTAVLFSIIHDITERKTTEYQLRQSEERYRLISENTADVIWVLDPLAGRFTYVSPSVERLRGYTPAEVMAQPVSEALTPESFQYVSSQLEKYLPAFIAQGEGNLSFISEVDQPRKDGSIVHTEVTTTLLFNSQGQVEIVGVTRDITERKRAEKELRALTDLLEQRVVERTAELQHAGRAKDEFLANMSHELRTPLNTVLGLSETLLEQRRGPLNDKQVHSLELIASSGRHLLGLINDILEVSKIEAGKLELHVERVSVKDVCESSLNFVRQLAAKKLIALSLHNEESGTTIDADPQRLKQILINLLTNAVKFTPERGQVNLDVTSNRERDQILFSVSDTGIGIAQEDLKKLFTPFTQLDSSLARQYSGTGLGLTLVQKFTDLHNGSVQVESVPGTGSKFTITLPLRQNLQYATLNDSVAGTVDRENSADHSSITSSTQGNILVAEDNKINLTFLADYLASRGYHVSTAQDGEELLEKAAQTAPDIILTDIQMPRMDGLQAIRHLRADARFTSTPIIALTALAMPGDKERCLEAGANEYMSKPVSLKKLAQTVQKLMTPKV